EWSALPPPSRPKFSSSSLPKITWLRRGPLVISPLFSTRPFSSSTPTVATSRPCAKAPSSAPPSPTSSATDSCCRAYTQHFQEMVYNVLMARTNIEIDEALVRKARKLTRLKTKRQIVARALELLVRSETRKGILRYYASGVWKGDLKELRKNRF